MGKGIDKRIKEYLLLASETSEYRELKMAMFILSSCYTDEGFVFPPDPCINRQTILKQFGYPEEKNDEFMRILFNRGLIATYFDGKSLWDEYTYPNLFDMRNLPEGIRASMPKKIKKKKPAKPKEDDNPNIWKVKIIDKPISEMNNQEMAHKYWEINGFTSVAEKDIMRVSAQIKAMSPTINRERFLGAVRIKKVLEPEAVYSPAWFTLSSIEYTIGNNKSLFNKQKIMAGIPDIDMSGIEIEMRDGILWKIINGDRIPLTKDEEKALKYQGA